MSDVCHPPVDLKPSSEAQSMMDGSDGTSRASLLSRYNILLNQCYSPHDAGLGCTVRSFQTLLTSALLHHKTREALCQSLESPRGELSFHSLTQGAPPRWLGPHALCSTLPLEFLNRQSPVHLIASTSSTVFAGDVKSSFPPPPSSPSPSLSSTSTLLLIPTRLSPQETLSEGDIATLKVALSDPCFAGMLGGPPFHMTCVLGLKNEGELSEVVVLDPHTIKPPNLPPIPLLPRLAPPSPPLAYPLHCLSTTLLLAFQFFTLEDFEGFQHRHFPLGPSSLSPTLPFLSLMPGKEADRPAEGPVVVPNLDLPPTGPPLDVKGEYVQVSERWWEEVDGGEGSTGTGTGSASASVPPPPPPPRANLRMRLTTLAWSAYALFIRFTAALPA